MGVHGELVLFRLAQPDGPTGIRITGFGVTVGVGAGEVVILWSMEVVSGNGYRIHSTLP